MPARPGARTSSRRGQTAVEYILVTTALLIAFVGVYKALQWYLTGQFRDGGVIIMRKYEVLP